jgi:xylulokinase
MSSYFLGLDSSTQSLSSVLLDLESGQILDDRSIQFDRDLPDYNTINGVFRHSNSDVVHSSPLLWAEALDRLFQQLKKEKLPLGEILAISGSGQQHGSVYMTGNAEKQIREMDLNGSLADNVARVLSRPSSPVWMDNSTAAECEEIRQALGGKEAAVAATGSDLFERFTGPQIRKFATEEPGAYRQTGHIALVSSFLSSLVAGQISPIDFGDGAGMNLMDIARFTWHPGALAATAPDLRSKLPPLAASHTILGVVNPYLVLKYGLNSSAKAVIWSGDNPCSLIGAGLVKPGMTAISLGTSDTLFGAMSECKTDPRGEGHVFGSPAGGYMSLICFKNGSLAREKVKDGYNLDWMEFSKTLRETPTGNDGKMMLPWFDPEIVPRVKAGVRRKHLNEDDIPGNCRAVVEAQMMSMRLHSTWMGDAPTRIYATGGSSANQEILQIMADVHNASVYRQVTANGAALGAAIRAAHAWTKSTMGDADWEQIAAPFTQPDSDSEFTPDPRAVDVYNRLVKDYAAFESSNLN